ncbi:Zinc metalloproteinase-disintegrin-like MTP8 [Halotydeus destructor]|nr:Zinc metalloproteinase-disintegrin-like MTP8 [Halotydeus destructor]
MMNLFSLIAPLIALNLIASTQCLQEGMCDDEYICGFNSSTARHLAATERLGVTSMPVRYIKVLLVADYEYYSRFFKSDKMRANLELFKIIRKANSLYSGLNVHLMVTGIELWTDKDRVPFQADMVALHKEMNIYQYLHYKDKYDYQATVFITGHYYKPAQVGGQKIIGLAYQNRICKGQNVATIMYANKYRKSTFTTKQLALTVVHEMAHLMGADHDDHCACPEEHCVMAAEECNTESWSQCTMDEITHFANLETTPDSCYQRPDSKKSQLMICGNGLVEKSELCDCHHLDTECKACCDMDTCRFTQETCVTTLPPPVTKPFFTDSRIKMIQVSGIILLVLIILAVLFVLLCMKDPQEVARGRETGDNMEMEPLMGTPDVGGAGVRKRTPNVSPEIV